MLWAVACQGVERSATSLELNSLIATYSTHLLQLEAAPAKLNLLWRQASQVLQLPHVGLLAKMLGLEVAVCSRNASAVYQGAYRHNVYCR